MSRIRTRRLGGYDGPATLICGDAEDTVHVVLSVFQEQVEAQRGEWLDGLPSWRGTLGQPAFDAFEAGTATLRLEHGAAGEISMGSPFEFSGNGAPPALS